MHHFPGLCAGASLKRTRRSRRRFVLCEISPAFAPGPH